MAFAYIPLTRSVSLDSGTFDLACFRFSLRTL